MSELKVTVLGVHRSRHCDGGTQDRGNRVRRAPLAALRQGHTRQREMCWACTARGTAVGAHTGKGLLLGMRRSPQSGWGRGRGPGSQGAGSAVAGRDSSSWHRCSAANKWGALAPQSGSAITTPARMMNPSTLICPFILFQQSPSSPALTGGPCSSGGMNKSPSSLSDSLPAHHFLEELQRQLPLAGLLACGDKGGVGDHAAFAPTARHLLRSVPGVRSTEADDAAAGGRSTRPGTGGCRAAVPWRRKVYQAK
jgi:hypothetical protein